MLKMQTTLSTYEEGHDGYVDIDLQIEPARIVVALVADHIENDDDTITAATWPRTVAVELRPDGRLQVLVYAMDQEEPKILALDAKGQIEELQ